MTQFSGNNKKGPQGPRPQNSGDEPSGDKNNKASRPGGGPSFFDPRGQWALLAMIFLACLFAVKHLGRSTNAPIAYSQFKQLVKAKQVQEVVLKGREVIGLTHQLEAAPNSPGGTKHFVTRVPDIPDNQLLSMLEEGGVKIRVVEAGESWMMILLANILPWILILGFFYYSSKKFRENMGNFSKGGLPFQKSKAREYKKADSFITFADVAGHEGTKKDLMEVVDFLKFPEKYHKIGAKLPKGVLLMGPPGTGKTLLAKATAGEANIPFYNINGSEFIEVFVGVGAGRVRDLFETAKKNAPAVIFIDEIDAIGRARGTGLGGGHDEREQTLNQILSEMDGFETVEPIVVMAATNRPDVLDPALIRPGRFDRQLTMDLPHKKARKQVLAIHCNKIPLSPKVSLEDLSEGTVGFSGADLANLVNEAALLTARKDGKEVGQQEFAEARDKVILGNVREEFISEKDKKITAYHEAGHTLVAYLMPEADPLRKVTIVPRGRALGVTEQAPAEDRVSYSKTYLENRISVLLGGRVAEEVIFDEITTGAENDLKEATKLALKMVRNWGMSKKIGLVSYNKGEDHHFLGKELAHERDFSEKTAELIDSEVQRLISTKKDETIGLIKQNEDKLHRLAQALIKEETLEKEAIEALLA